MKLSRLYSNREDIFSAVDFNPGLNAVVAEIRLPENRNKDTHNLGKTTLGQLINFGLLAKRNPNFFLFKYPDLFQEFVFFLEIELGENSYLTVRRSVEKASRISFKRHSDRHQDFSVLAVLEWDHPDVPFDRAVDLIDSLLDLGGIKPWSFRNGLGYLLRSQDDFREVFQLTKFAGPHADWKPFLAHLLGFDAEIISQHYNKEKELLDKEKTISTLMLELKGAETDGSKIEGILLLKRQELESKQHFLDEFDFREPDKDKTKYLVDDLDKRIARLNSRRYSQAKSLDKIVISLDQEKILFDPRKAEKLFKEAGVLFQGQIKRDFQQLISFNKAITDERGSYLVEERSELELELKHINEELDQLGKERSEMLSFLSDSDIFDKYKRFSEEIIKLRVDIESLDRQREGLHRLLELRAEVRKLSEEKGNLQTKIEADVEAQNQDRNGRFAQIRLFFNEIVEKVLDSKALLSVSANKLGHLDFKADILDKSGNATSAGLGHTYRKLLCVAFDLAVIRAHLDDQYPRFVFHDGIFETLDDRKKVNLLEIVRQYAGMGIQAIVTAIDSDLPIVTGSQNAVFYDREIVLMLHDENEQGRIFKMQSW